MAFHETIVKLPVYFASPSKVSSPDGASSGFLSHFRNGTVGGDERLQFETVGTSWSYLGRLGGG